MYRIWVEFDNDTADGVFAAVETACRTETVRSGHAMSVVEPGDRNHVDVEETSPRFRARTYF